jgi:D-3-phosphoglycerate dehydrogenase
MPAAPGKESGMAGSRVLVTVPGYGSWSDALQRLTAGGCEVIRGPVGSPVKEADLLAALQGCSAIIAGGDPLSRGVIEGCPELRVIARFGVGMDTVDVAAATERGIPVAIATNQEAVADLTFALLLGLARRIVEADAFTRSGQWGPFCGWDVWRRTIGVIGTGRIGAAVMRRARGFDLRILCHDVRPDRSLTRSLGAEYVGLDCLLSESDFVTLHCPITESTRGLIGRRELALMKPTGLLINTARPGIVDEAALAEALRDKRLAGYATDVYAPAPPPRDWPLFSFPNVIATPWMASRTPDNLRSMELACAENVLRVLAGDPPLAAVSAPRS